MVSLWALEAAIQAKPLSRDQYLLSKRSNVENQSQTGRETRDRKYNEYECYAAWKRATNKYDVNDLVLRLLKWQQENQQEIFSACYLDEVQDLPYEAIYLLCSIGGRSALNWICAGDPAQMISPGCSFTFDGLKQTLLAVQPRIEAHLKTVNRLLVNYRTTKDVLILGNAILDEAKRHFGGAIGFISPKVAMNDLGFQVVLCDWEKAWSQNVKFGRNQA